MFNYKFLMIVIGIMVSIQGCSKILEPVLLSTNLKNNDSLQEEFDINISVLTFDNARKANKYPYSRQLMLTGSGARAKVTNEKEFLTKKIPENLKSPEYQLGFGDELSFSVVPEFIKETLVLPITKIKKDYLLGKGDQLTLVQFTDTFDIGVEINEKGGIKPTQSAANIEKIFTTQGIIGDTGKVTFLSIGTLQANGRTLEDLQKEVRIILIRNGLTPNFQLEITKFNSKKIFITSDNPSLSKVIPITNIPLSLKELVLSSGVSVKDANRALIRLTRQNKLFRFTAEQLFDSSLPDIALQNGDAIEIQINKKDILNITAGVGSKGNILLPEIAEIKATGRTLSELHKDIHNILSKQGIMPNFQLEITKFRNKKVYFIKKNIGSNVISLTNQQMSLKELILLNKGFSTPGDGLAVVTLKRNKNTYRFPIETILDLDTPDIWLQSDDQIELEVINYKTGQVYALSGSGNATIVPINPSKRETLANILFTPGGAFNNLAAKRSEVYLLRGNKPAVAYHLDAQNVSRILVAANTELRPNDIVYVAERPIISFSRVLAEITPLRILLKDLEDGNIP